MTSTAHRSLSDFSAEKPPSKAPRVGSSMGWIGIQALGKSSGKSDGPIRVKEPGQRLAQYDEMSSIDAIPAHYKSDPRFTELSQDPAHGNEQTGTSLREAMTGLESEQKGFIQYPISRGPAEIEFYDAKGHPYDVKTPRSPLPEDRWLFNPRKAARSIVKQIEKQFPNSKTGKSEPVRVLLDCTYLSKADHEELWGNLKPQLDEKLSLRIIELNVRV